MDIIIGDRREGKTYTLINEYFLKDKNTYLCVSFCQKKDNIAREYRLSKEDEDRIFLFDDRKKFLVGKDPVRILIDDVDILIHYLFSGLLGSGSIQAITISNGPFTNYIGKPGETLKILGTHHL